MRSLEDPVARRGGAIALWVVLWCLVLGGVTEALGLKYAQRFQWPTDLLAFQHGGFEQIDVAILGSSRVGFGLPADGVADCLQSAVGREVTAVNLARMYSTVFSMEALAKDLLDGDYTPQVLVLGISPEALDDHNPKRALNVPFHADYDQLPSLLAQVRSWSDLVATVRVVARGPENLALFAAGAHDGPGRMRWLMLHEGGGQWCFGDEGCIELNERYRKRERGRWDLRMIDEIPHLAQTRFPDFQIGGREAEALERLAIWSRERDVTLILVDLPVHRVFAAQIPDEIDALYRAWLDDFSERSGVQVLSGLGVRLLSHRQNFIDPDHLAPRAARTFSASLCESGLAAMLDSPGSTVN